MSQTPEQNPPSRTEPKCKPPVAPTPPKMPDPEKCDPKCCCPPGPGGTGGSCLDGLISEQAHLAEKAALAKDFADELRALQDKMLSARANFTNEKYQALLKDWQDQDTAIGKLADDVACSVKCWSCLLECRLCPLLQDIRALERQLNGTGTFATTVDTLRERASWHERNRDERQAVVNRIKDVLAAWEDPAKTLEDTLTANKALIDTVRGMLSTDAPGALYALFVTLIPRHWAIRPRSATSKVKDYVEICTCGEIPPDDCCGPDTAIGTTLQRLLPPLPYLVDPNGLADILCCLVTQRYLPQVQLLADAHAQFEAAKQDVERATAQVKAKIDALEAAFKAELSTPIDCTPYRTKNGPDDDCKDPEPKKPGTPEQSPTKQDTPKQSGA
ncbi:hypothetical protein LYSHEL_00500 [Lysobacter helvus]|uniref:Uncharacterized protein n=2 Tax=Lysobacteraceae TaxID=32033 RepID=A0ABM7Q1D3_9GAMM|nr:MULTISPECIES: hypothetical protein [Lysobacter]BCT91026.1 hypothetical protein LYSCAS_00500 [Lysobacter caseinilyticus]BCT94179.1 hypothetical protein LYSHEL_00500 [Lysobacter helvus]